MAQLTEQGMEARQRRFEELIAGLKEEKKLAGQFKAVAEGHKTYLAALDTILAKLDVARSVMAATTARMRFERENKKRRRSHTGYEKDADRPVP